MITKILRGSDIKVFINGKLFRPVNSIQFSASTGRKAISGIDFNDPFELAPGPTKITGSVTVHRLRGSGGLEGAGIAAPDADILLEKYFSIAIVDRLTDSVILYVEECAIIDQSWQVGARGIMDGSFTWEGVGWSGDAQ